MPSPVTRQSELFVVVELPSGPVAREIFEVIDIMHTPKNRKIYGVKWAIVVADRKESAVAEWRRYRASPDECVVYGMCLIAEGTNHAP